MVLTGDKKKSLTRCVCNERAGYGVYMGWDGSDSGLGLVSIYVATCLIFFFFCVAGHNLNKFISPWKC
jgi:hypothetical protein